MVAVRNLEFMPAHHGDGDRSRTLRVVVDGRRRRRAPGVYRRRRLVVGVVAAVVVLAALQMAAPVLGDPALVPREAGGVHVVAPGDTYWSIAAALDTDGDTTETVAALVVANGDRALRLGERIVVPG